MNGEAAQTESVAADQVVTIGGILAECIQLNGEKKAAEKVLDDIKTRLDQKKELIKELYIQMGVDSMKSGKKTVYLQRQIFAGIAEDTSREKLADALIKADMEEFITCNTQKLSGYVRELVKDHPELCNENGNIIAEPETILAILPEPFNKLFKVSEKTDIRIRG